MIERLMRRLRARSRVRYRVQHSSFELIEWIDIRGVIVAISGDDHRQANRGFGSGDRNGKDCEHHAGWLVWLRSETPERDKIQIRSGQHQLDADEDENRVTPTKRRQESDGKQCAGNGDEGLQCGCHRSPSRKRPTSNVQRSTYTLELRLN